MVKNTIKNTSLFDNMWQNWAKTKDKKTTMNVDTTCGWDDIIPEAKGKKKYDLHNEFDVLSLNSNIKNGVKKKKSVSSFVSPPALSYFQLFKFATKMDKIMIFFALLSSLFTGAVAPLNALIFSELTEAMVLYALSMNPDVDPPAGVELPTEDDFIHAVKIFALRNVGLGCILLVFSYSAAMLANYTAHNQVFTIRKTFLQSALRQDISYYDLNDSGDFASRMTDDLLKLEDGIGEKMTTCFHYWISFAGCIILAFVRCWHLTFVCLATFPLMLIAVGSVNIMSSRLSKRESQAYGVAGAIAEEVLSGIRTVVAFDGQKKEAIRYRENLVNAKNINIKRSFFTGFGIGSLFLCNYLTYALSFWYGISLYLKYPAQYNPSVLVSVFFGVLMGTSNFGWSTPFIEIFGMAKGAGAKIFAIINNIPLIDPLADRGIKPNKCQGNISFTNVYFNYPSRPEVKILQGLNLNIRCGQTVAIVGGSGCGKSTCIQLVQRFYDPLRGSITVDDNNVKDLSITWLRSNIGVVGQEPVLFNTTIGENIRYGYENATIEDIEKAARQANAHYFIKTLPQGYNTIVGERGTQLSGGQKQRIAIARALVRNPKILLLDEATSALDNASEAKVQIALDKASEGRTTIIVAHRLSTIKTADEIIALHEGKVVEQGSHSQLMHLKGHYYNLVMAQTSGESSDMQRQISQPNDTRRPSTISSGSVDEDDMIHITKDNVEDENTNEVPILSIWKIAHLNRPDWPYVTIGCICSLLMGAAVPIFSVLFGEIIGSLGSGDPEVITNTTNFFCVVFLIAGVIAGLATFFSIFMFGIAGERMTMRLRGDAFEAMLKQEIGWFDDKANSTGALCARLSGEASAVQGATGQRIGTIIQSLATLTLAISLSIYFEWRLGLVALSFMPFTLVTTVLHRKVATSENFGSSKAMERSTKLAVDVIGSIRTVASLGREEMFLDQFIKELEPAMMKAKRNTHFRGAVYGVARSLIFFAFAASIFYGGYLIREKNVNYYDVLRVSQALILATISVSNALTFAPNLQRGIQSASRILYLLNRKPKIVDPDTKTDGNYETQGQVKYLGVDFAYPTRPYLRILNKLGLTIPPNKTVALVGASGCGKSTCIQLLERFYDPIEGKVLLDSCSINELMLDELRKNLGIVSQEPILFDLTIGENIAYGDNSRTPTQNEIIEAAKNANIHNFITSLPMGYDTRLGTRGTQLSGGQKQRVAIARALLRNPRILLLDEATSALDTESEKIVQEALDKAKIGRTCIVIAHRLSTIQDADLICVFNEGRVAESGTHSQLMERKGIYYRLQNQSKKNK